MVLDIILAIKHEHVREMLTQNMLEDKSTRTTHFSQNVLLTSSSAISELKVTVIPESMCCNSKGSPAQLQRTTTVFFMV